MGNISLGRIQAANLVLSPALRTYVSYVLYVHYVGKKKTSLRL